MRKLTKEDLEDIIVGCSYVGSGGGGALAGGLKKIYDDLNAGLVFQLMSIDEFGDDEHALRAMGLGSTAPATSEEDARFANLPRIQGTPAEAAVRVLERHLDKKLSAVTPGELGPANTSTVLSVAAHLKLPILDIDLVGRSAPELNQSSLAIAGISPLPLAGATQFGDEFVIEKVGESSRVEEILRAVSVVSRGVSAAGSLTGAVLKRPGVVNFGSITHVENIGRAFRAAVNSKSDPVSAVTAAGNGYRIFEGVIADFTWKNDAGFLVGDVTMSGTGPDQSSKFRIWYKNESIIAWKDNLPAVLPPDLIITLRRDTGEALPNPHYEKGDFVVVISFPGPALARTPAGLAHWGPKHFGFDIPYTPIEQLVKH
jgi:uncharacterized protein